MTIPAFSSTGLKYAPLIDSWKMSELNLDPLETDMNGGNKRLRGRPGDNVQRIQFGVLYTKAQWTTLFAWHRDTLFGGTSRFTMTVWLGDAFSLKTVQFAAKLSLVAVEPRVQANFDLWVFN